MKTFTRLLTMLAIAISAMTLVSCDDDEEVARYLDGSWRGNMHVYSSWNGREYAATYSEIEFYRGYTSGTGVWVDYYSNAPWDYVANHFQWYVTQGTIYIHFVEEDTDAVIYDYQLDSYQFSGYLEVVDGDYAYFSLDHISSPNWDYIDNWGYNVDYGYQWSRASEKVDSTILQTNEKPQRIFKR